MSERTSRWGSPTVFAAVLIAFLLPFATVSCGAEEVTFTGTELALHQVPEGTAGDGSLAGDIESYAGFWALVALGSAVAGLALGVLRKPGGGIASAVGLAAMLMLVWHWVTTLATVELHAGFALALLGYVAAAVGHAARARRARRGRRPADQETRRRRRIAVAATATLVLVALVGSGALQGSGDGADDGWVDFGTADHDPAWSPDGREIAFERDGAVHVIQPDGSCRERLLDGTEPAWSPDGRRLAVTRCRGETCSIEIVNRDGSTPRRLAAGKVHSPAFSADGKQVYFTREEDDLTMATWVVRTDGSGLRRAARPWAEIGDPRWSIGAVSENDPTFSPDGTRYAFAASDDATAEAIFGRDVRGGERRRLSDPGLGVGDYEPAWSPDGARIAFQRSGQIAVMAADGSGERVLTSVSGATDPAWSPDSREIVFANELHGGIGSAPSALMILDVEAGDVRKLTWGPTALKPCG